MAIQSEIIRLGSKGDGFSTDGHYVPFALPGETIELDHSAGLKIITQSPHRIKPVCRHFTACGGCALQHLERDQYLQWKRQQVIDAFAIEGLTPDIGPCISVAPNSRRRANFTASVAGSSVVLGFQARRSHEVIDLDECPVLVSSISSRLDDFRKLARLLKPGRETVMIAVLACDNGLDVSVETSNPLPAELRNGLVKWAIDAEIARLSCNTEIIVQTTRPVISVSTAVVSPPPGAFAQAVVTAEQQMIKLATKHLQNCARVADLFAGFGTFALNLSKRSSVHAVEYEESALLALGEAAGRGKGLKEITTERRDLIRRPLQTSELNNFDGVIFDPPRAGAEHQVAQLAKSEVAKIAAVSCNPATLARDVKILVNGGYKITNIAPIDQFLFSHHVEAVVLLERKKMKTNRKIFG